MQLLDRDTRAAVEQFLIRESALLDDGQWEAWQQLYTADAVYWMPLDSAQPDGEQHVSLIYDNRTLLDLRCRRLRDADDASSLALQPFPRLLRFLSNVTVARADDGALRAGARLLAAQLGGGTLQQFHARVEWTLTGAAPDFRIARKRVDLLTAGTPLRDILVYL